MNFLRDNCSREELFLVFLAIGMGVILRASETDRLAVEHFDEGVYSSSIWYESPDGEPYPMRHLYAPPMLPWLIRICHDLSGGHPVAPFIPGMAFGAATLLVAWLACRMWFGMNAGLFVVFVGAFSDFHIIFSRMALTDVPVLFWILASVFVASIGLQRESRKWMIAAGCLAGLAWWTKYSGWLSLAIIGSGSGFWWIVSGRRRMSLFKLAGLVGTVFLTAGLVWAPWVWMLQDEGGYAAVRANHAGYFSGLDGWQDRMANHLIYHFRFESWFGATALGLGAMAAGTRRWIELRLPRPAPAGAAAKLPRSTFPPPRVLGRYVLAALGLGIVALSMSSTGLLACLALAGLAGAFLWPVQVELFRARESGDTSSQVEGAVGLQSQDVRAAAAIDPFIGLCFTTAWLLGMLLTTPMYQAYPRLGLPLLAALWFGASAGISWWMEAVLNAARLGGARTALQQRSGRIVRILAIVALAVAVSGSFSFNVPLVWQNRSSLRDASLNLAAIARADARGEYVPEEAELNLDDHGNLTPEPQSSDDEPRPSTFFRLRSLVAKPVDVEQFVSDNEAPELVMLAFGEPAVLSHLSSVNVPAAPVAQVNLQPIRDRDGNELSTYLVLGPHALRTPEFLNEWVQAQYRFEHVADVWFSPSEVLLYNLFNPKWVIEHMETSVQKLELYRLKSEPVE